MLTDLIGHHKNKQLFIELLKSQKIPEVFLFYGPEGVGKFTFAKSFAYSLVNRRLDLLKQKHDHPDIRVVSVEEKNTNHTILSIRQIKEDVYLPPFTAHKKVFIIEDAHKMLPAASNALLKTLEEPAESSILILLAPSISEVLPTIASRCCKISFAPLKEEEILDFLVKEKSVEKELAEVIANESFGSIDQALLFLDEEERKWQNNLVEVILDYQSMRPEVFQEKVAFLDQQIEKKGASFQTYLYEVILKVFRDISFVKEGGSGSFLYFKQKEEKIKKSALNISHSFDILEKIWEEAHESLTYHVKLKVGLEVLLLRLYQ